MYADRNIELEMNDVICLRPIRKRRLKWFFVVFAELLKIFKDDRKLTLPTINLIKEVKVLLRVQSEWLYWERSMGLFFDHFENEYWNDCSPYSSKGRQYSTMTESYRSQESGCIRRIVENIQGWQKADATNNQLDKRS